MFDGKNSGAKKKKFGSGRIPGDTCLISNAIYVLIPGDICICNEFVHISYLMTVALPHLKPSCLVWIENGMKQRWSTLSENQSSHSNYSLSFGKYI